MDFLFILLIGIGWILCGLLAVYLSGYTGEMRDRAPLETLYLISDLAKQNKIPIENV